MCVKCSAYDSLHAETAFDEDEVEFAPPYAGNNDYGDSAYELAPAVDATYCDEVEENCFGDVADGTGGTSTSLEEPQWRSSCSMFLKLKAILPLERQPIPVAKLLRHRVKCSDKFGVATWSKANCG